MSFVHAAGADDCAARCAPEAFALLAAALLLIFFPAIATWLPGIAG